jgi:hypothetical protein
MPVKSQLLRKSTAILLRLTFQLISRSEKLPICALVARIETKFAPDLAQAHLLRGSDLNAERAIDVKEAKTGP